MGVELKAGAQVLPRLRLVSMLGEGGMGAVWIAYHETLKTQVAVKFLRTTTRRSPAVIERFEREAAIAAQLKSPHVAHTYDHGLLPDGTPYIVMELLEGESLDARIKRGPLSLRETSLVVSQTAQALAKAHKLGIVHRDVKPANLFLLETDYDLFVKLLDFGIAKNAAALTESELTRTGSLLGSPLYMSPEQFIAVKSVDWRADLWSLAVVAYRCLTAQPPFHGEALGNLMMAVTQGLYTPATQLQPSLPAGLDPWFAKAFDVDVEARHQSAKELATSFMQVVRQALPAGTAHEPLSITDTTPAPTRPQNKTVPLSAMPAVGAPPHPTSVGFPTPAAAAPLGAQLDGSLSASTTTPSADAATFSPAATTIGGAGDGSGKKLAGVALAALLLAGAGVGAYVMFAGDGPAETEAKPAASAATAPSANPLASAATSPEPSAEPSPSAGSSASPEPLGSVSAFASASAAASAPPSATPSSPAPKPVTVTRPWPRPNPRPQPAKTIPSDTGF